MNLQQRFFSSKMIYGVTSPELIFLAKLYSAGRRRHGNAVSVNFIKCVRRVRDTVNSAAAYIEFSRLNGNPVSSYNAPRFLYVEKRVLSTSSAEYASSLLSYLQLRIELRAFVHLAAHLYDPPASRTYIDILLLLHSQCTQWWYFKRSDNRQINL